MNNENEIVELIQGMTEKSIAGEILWDRPNATTFVWSKNSNGDKLRVILQRATKQVVEGTVRKKTNSYLFTVSSRAKGVAIVTINSEEKPYLTPVLESLFQAAEKSDDIRTASVIRDLLS